MYVCVFLDWIRLFKGLNFLYSFSLINMSLVALTQFLLVDVIRHSTIKNQAQKMAELCFDVSNMHKDLHNI